MFFVKGWIATTTLLAWIAYSSAFFIHPNPTVRSTPKNRIDFTLSFSKDDNEQPHNVDVGATSSMRRKLFTTSTMLVLGLASQPDISFATDPLHKVDYPVEGKCGQADNVPENAVFFVKNFGGFKDGSCATEGYNVNEGTAKGTGEKDKEREYTIYGK